MLQDLFRILKQRKEYAHLGDVIRVAIKEASPTSSIKKGSVATAVIVRTGNPIRREDGSTVHFDQNACVLVDSKLNPIGTRVFGPVARELRDKNYMSPGSGLIRSNENGYRKNQEERHGDRHVRQ